MGFQNDGMTPKLFNSHLIVGGDSLEGELVNSQAPKIAIYLHMNGSEASGQCTYKHQEHLSASDSSLASLPHPHPLSTGMQGNHILEILKILDKQGQKDNHLQYLEQ